MKKTIDSKLIVAVLAATMVIVLSPMVGACAESIVIFDDPTLGIVLYDQEDITVRAHVFGLEDGEVIELFGNRLKDGRPWGLGSFSRDGNRLTLETGIGCCPDCGSDTFVFYAAKKRSDAKCGVVEFFSNMREFQRVYHIVGVTVFQRVCSEPCQEEVAVWFNSPKCGDNVGVDTTEIPVSWGSRGTEYLTILGLATTNQPWDERIVYLMDVLDGSKLGGSSIFYVGSCKDTEDGNGVGATTEYLELIAVKDEDLEEVKNLDWPVNRAALDKYVQASDNVWVERPCGCCCGQIQ